ncbi:MAG: hypothetical protein R2706_09385 [Acidimicrobiales bacterium]
MTTNNPTSVLDFPQVPGSKSDPILVVDSLKRSFGGLTAVNVQHVEIQRGLITALIDQTAPEDHLLNLLTNFDQPDTGSVVFDGVDVTGKPSHNLAKMGMIRTFQLTKVMSKMTVIDNMKLKRLTRKVSQCSRG